MNKIEYKVVAINVTGRIPHQVKKIKHAVVILSVF
jgi:hypothetical protein